MPRVVVIGMFMMGMIVLFIRSNGFSFIKNQLFHHPVPFWHRDSYQWHNSPFFTKPLNSHSKSICLQLILIAEKLLLFIISWRNV